MDSVIIAQKPVLGPSLHLMVSAMEKVLLNWSGRIHLKVKSGEGWGGGELPCGSMPLGRDPVES